ncbi:MAG: ATP-binding protein [Flavobacteriaceae bacterium]|nr:ATP-binding protein [Flavobacteriaceae bacterium]
MNDKFKDISKHNLWEGQSYDKGFVRKQYQSKIIPFLNTKLVKVLVGQRRAGKSFFLKQIAMQLVEEKGVNRKNILYINLEFLAFDFIKTYQDLEELFQWYKKELKPKGKVYLFVDEIQNIQGWEKFVNSHSQDFTEETELFITGSNSNLLSGELATLLSGRYIEFEIFPFDFNEFCLVKKQEQNRKSYLDFINFGGLPELFNLTHYESQKQYVSSIKDTVLLRDIVNRSTIRDVKLLDDLFVYLVNNASNLLSITNLVNYFKSKKRKTSYETVANYIQLIENTFLIHKCERYNIKGKEIVGGNAKYYVNDLAFKNLLFSGFGYGMGYLLENRVFLDLKQAGFTVYTGNLGKNEVDFVAQKEDRILYIQCAYLLEDEKTIEREYGVLKKIKDNFEKWVVSLDEVNLPKNEGIRHIQAWNLSKELM